MTEKCGCIRCTTRMGCDSWGLRFGSHECVSAICANCQHSNVFGKYGCSECYDWAKTNLHEDEIAVINA